MLFSNVHKSFILRCLTLAIVCLFSFYVSACAGNEDGNYDSCSTLINCKTCNGKVSKNTFFCPHCGERSPAPVSKQAAPTAKRAAAIAKAATIAKVVNLYTLDMGLSAPSNDFDLEVLLLSSDDGGGPSGPYLERANDLIDPWGTPFEIEIPGIVNNSFDIISWGEDGEPGGEGVNEDITQ